jgi:hypothetical protein
MPFIKLATGGISANGFTVTSTLYRWWFQQMEYILLLAVIAINLKQLIQNNTVQI